MSEVPLYWHGCCRAESIRGSPVLASSPVQVVKALDCPVEEPPALFLMSEVPLYWPGCAGGGVNRAVEGLNHLRNKVGWMHPLH